MQREKRRRRKNKRLLLYNHTKCNAHQVNNTHHQKQQHNMIVEEMNSVTIRVKQMLFEETFALPEERDHYFVRFAISSRLFFRGGPLLPC